MQLIYRGDCYSYHPACRMPHAPQAVNWRFQGESVSLEPSQGRLGTASLRRPQAVNWRYQGNYQGTVEG